jgi:hypothetical protein
LLDGGGGHGRGAAPRFYRTGRWIASGGAGVQVGSEPVIRR